MLKSNYILILPNSIYLDKEFSISVRFLNSTNLFNFKSIVNKEFEDNASIHKKSKNFHTLLQSSNGISGMFVIDDSLKSIGCFTNDGLWYDLGINLKKPELVNKYIHVTFSYLEEANKYKANTYLNGVLIKSSIKKNLILSKSIKYIANSTDGLEPFSFFSDLKIFNYFIDKYMALSVYKCKIIVILL